MAEGKSNTDNDDNSKKNALCMLPTPSLLIFPVETHNTLFVRVTYPPLPFFDTK